MKKVISLVISLMIIFLLGFSIIQIMIYKDISEPREKFLITFDNELLHSNLYPPKNVQISSVSNSSVKISWNFENKELVVPEGMAREYAILSGFRVYRDGYWLTDVPKADKSYIDTGLYADNYTYSVSALTFDNKIEGLKTVSVSNDSNSESKNDVNFPKNKFSSYLAVGDSITLGQRAATGNGWVDQVGFYLSKQNPKVKIINKGVSGAFAATVKESISEYIPEYNPDLVTIAIGINDFSANSRDIGNYSQAEFRDHLRTIISLANPKERSVLLLNIYHIECCFDSISNTDKRLVWNKLIRDIANESGVVLVDVSGAMGDKGGKILLDDALHPNQAGHNLIAKTVIDAIIKHIK